MGQSRPEFEKDPDPEWRTIADFITIWTTDTRWRLVRTHNGIARLILWPINRAQRSEDMPLPR